MKWILSAEKLPQLFSAAALALGLWIAQTPIVQAGPGCNCPQGRPYYRSDMPPSEDGAGAEGTDDTGTGADADTAPRTDDDAVNLQPQTQTPSSTDLASLGPGANTPMLGRLDQNMRLNLFDTQSAMTDTRVWYSFQYAEGYNLDTYQAVGGSSTGSPAFFDAPLIAGGVPVTRTDVRLHRLGFEYALYEDFSVSFQAQYCDVDSIFTAAGAQSPDDWSNPQAMLKYVVLCDKCTGTTVSAILGATFETDTQLAELNEQTSRIFPGVLFHQDVYEDFFYQGGFQFGLPTRSNNIDTFDWALGCGYWLYQDCGSSCGGCGCDSCDSCGCGSCGGCGCDSCCDDSSWEVSGVVLQIELLGKHVIGNNVIVDPFELDTLPGGYGPGGSVFIEDRDVLDLTFGGTAQMHNGVAIGVAYSVPVTEKDVRRSEFITTINYRF